LIFIEVALTRTVMAQVQPLLDPDSPVDDPAQATCAIFYSITNCQQGLRGVSFGNVLIKQVVEDLGKEFPRVKTFATLSPIPGFRSWLVDRAAVAPASISPALATLVSKGDDVAAADIAAAPRALREEMIERCARYLISGRGAGRRILSLVSSRQWCAAERLWMVTPHGCVAAWSDQTRAASPIWNETTTPCQSTASPHQAFNNSRPHRAAVDSRRPRAQESGIRAAGTGSLVSVADADWPA
jgi:hypothetical protein